MALYKNIVQWNDSAGEEAFLNAKARFWAQLNGLPCAISLPDPDIYIDKIDWNSYIDPELLSDLDQEPVVPDNEERDGNLGHWGNGLDSAFLNQPIPCTGWGDADDTNMPINDLPMPGQEHCDWNVDNNHACGHSSRESRAAEGNSWESGSFKKWESGWRDNSKNADTTNAWGCNAFENADHDNAWNNRGHNQNAGHADNSKAWGHSNWKGAPHSNGWNNNGHNKTADHTNSWGCSDWENADCSNAWDSGGWENRIAENNSWENGWGQWGNNVKPAENLVDPGNNGGDWRIKAGDYRKREGGRYVPRNNHNNTTRFQGDHCQTNGGWRNGKGRKRASFVHERPVINKRPLAPWQWNSIRSCGPVNHDEPSQPGNRWSWEKPVS